MTEVDLDNPASYSRLDPDEMFRRVGELPEQMANAWQLAGKVRLPAAYREVSSVVIAGMGGSAIGGSLLETYGAGENPIPVDVWRNYGLPRYVDDRSLVIAASYSGNTEETLSAFKEGRRRGANLLAITTGGEIGKLASDWDVPSVRFNYDAQPRAALGYLFTPLVRLFQDLGFLANQETAFLEALDLAKRARQEWGGDVEIPLNRAKRLAAEVHGKGIVIYGADYLAPVARRWKTQLNENSKTWAFYEELPELNHNAIVGYEYPQTATQSLAVLVLTGSEYPDRIMRRVQVTKELMRKYGVSHHFVQSEGKSRLAQMIWYVALGDYVSYYLALLNGADPTVITPIDTLKAELARNVP